MDDGLKEKLPGVEQGVLLKDYTSFKIGGPAKYFFNARTNQDLTRAIKAAKELDIPFFILGGGSNLLVSDNGFNGLVIRVCNSRLEAQNSHLIASAGAKLIDLVSLAAESSLAGFEWAAGIPGTLGGAVSGNAGAFSKWMNNVVDWVDVFDAQSLAVKKLDNQECEFGHKISIFKKKPNLIILSAKIRLEKGDKTKIQKQINEYIELRKQKHPLDFPSAGCVFENYVPKKNEWRPEFVQFKKLGAIPTGFLIDQCGLKGSIVGQAQISEKHANFIINLGGASSQDVVDLINLAKTKVKQKFGIDIKEEIQYLGFFTPCGKVCNPAGCTRF